MNFALDADRVTVQLAVALCWCHWLCLTSDVRDESVVLQVDMTECVFKLALMQRKFDQVRSSTPKEAFG